MTLKRTESKQAKIIVARQISIMYVTISERTGINKRSTCQEFIASYIEKMDPKNITKLNEMGYDGINPHVFTMEQDEFIKALGL